MRHLLTRRVLIIAGVVWVLLIGVAIVAAFTRGSNTGTEHKNTVSGAIEEKVEIDNAHEYSQQIDEMTIESAEKGLYPFIRQGNTDPNIVYHGTIRKNSLATSMARPNYPVITFLVDFPEQKRTYRIKVEGSDSTEYKTVYALCPQPADQIYQPSPCNDTP